MHCHEATQLVSQAQDRALGLRERVTLRLHLLVCAGCRNFSAHLPVLRQLTQAYRERQDERLEPVEAEWPQGKKRDD